MFKMWQYYCDRAYTANELWRCQTNRWGHDFWTPYKLSDYCDRHTRSDNVARDYTATYIIISYLYIVLYHIYKYKTRRLMKER